MPTLNRRREANPVRRDPFRWVYQSYRWHKQSALFIKKNPLCAACLKVGKTERAQVTDHVIPLVLWVPMGGDPFDQKNWQPLSKSCHSIKTAKENG